jgi:glycosyltransferase involved in cell wall biosynthesis
VTLQKVDPAVCTVLNNAVDPFIKLPKAFTKPANLLKRYGLCGNYPIIFTLTRLASTEQYKGHDQVIKVISRLKHKFPGITYILSGQYDDDEKIRLQKLIAGCGVEEQVMLTGFIAEEELADHFLLADLFVLPSKKEGFGIVFIEALACGLPVICGNADGSVDAICNGELGKAIDVEDLDALEEAVCEVLKTPLTVSYRQNLQERCMHHFNKTDYMKKLEIMLSDEFTQ